MSNIKKDLLREIDNKVKRKKALAAVVSKDKTIAKLVSKFFEEEQSMSDYYLISLALTKLTLSIQKIDSKSYVVYKSADKTNSEPQVEINWSEKYLKQNSCEATLVMSLSEAAFQATMEDS